MIVVDVHEPDEVKEWLDKNDAEWREEGLKAGDYVVKDVIIERKTYGDFIGRLKNAQRDIWQQMLKVDAASDEMDYRPVLMLEGEWGPAMQWTNLTPKPVTAAIASIFKMDISVVHVMGPRAVAQFLAKLDDGSEHQTGKIRDTPSVPLELMPRYLTEGFRGVGQAKAEDLLDRYGTFGAIVKTIMEDPEDLKEVSGIGDGTVDKMIEDVT